MANYLVTGAAGFIGARTSELLIHDGHTVVGVDNINNAYDLRMKEYRLNRLQAMDGFTFHKLDISDKSIIEHFKDNKFAAECFTYLERQVGAQHHSYQRKVFQLPLSGKSELSDTH